MDKGSLDGIYKRNGPIPIEVVGKIAWAVLKGLTYLYDVHRIIHRGTYSALLSSHLTWLLARRHQTVEYTMQLRWRDQSV
jgi:hypothetical protein